MGSIRTRLVGRAEGPYHQRRTVSLCHGHRREDWAIVIRAEVSDASCLHCHHLDQLSDVVHNHRVLHAKHLDLGVKCSDCHAGLVHGNLYGCQAGVGALRRLPC
jgi:hypothetical protein